ncbi:hypothetical protein LPJ61_000780 [Coemansia biformis]|uniref:Pentacotripeptide-repeat region of PRORP domain-containing protein n=1 Tax=Coemansia biformis TaxID=1286918 RepID=A0A9W7YH94_9FUNG|nr:hypothetical protein LPJ61_000780 [Coemansia biformis]
MASRLLGRPAFRLACAHATARTCSKDGSRRTVHASGALPKLFSRSLWGLFRGASSEPAAPDADTSTPLAERLGANRRRGGYDRGGGMPLYVPVKAKNVEKAWEIWSVHLRQADPAARATPRGSLVDLLMLLVRSAEPHARNSHEPDDDAVEGTAQNRQVAAYRVAALLRHVFALTIREQGAGSPATDSGMPALEDRAGIDAFKLGLGLQHTEDYEEIATMLLEATAGVMPSGNTASLDGLVAADLAQEIEEASLSRLAQALVHAAIADRIPATAWVLRPALEVAVAMHDTAAARDILVSGHADLAALLDARLPAVAQNAELRALDDPNGVDRDSIVEAVLRLVEVGSDPRGLDGAASSDQQQDLAYSQLESLVDYSAGEEPPEVAARARSWRAAAAERIYRAHVSSGFAEVPSPDASSQSALLGSVVPTEQMLVSLLKIHLAAGSAEQAAIVYETLRVVVQEETAQETGSSAILSSPTSSSPRELQLAHRMAWPMWSGILESACAAGNLWLAARILGDMAGDGWAPTQSMYSQYLGALQDLDEAALAGAIDAIHESMLASGVSAAEPAVREPLVRALVDPRYDLPAGAMAVRIERALALSGLALQGTAGATAAAAVDGVSDEAAREIVAALIADNQIARAQELAGVWSAARPELVTSRCLTDLVRGLGATGRHGEALQLFADFQQSGEGELTAELLGAVLDVYMHAGDYAEAISVGKRIRALVAADQARGNFATLPGHATYNHLIQAYCEEMQPGEALHVLEEMRRYKLHATPETYTTLAIAMSNLRSFEGLRLVNALANVDYNIVAPVPADRRAQRNQPALPLTTDYYNALIEAYGRVAEPEIALQVWELMRFRGVRPDGLTATLLIDTCAWNERVHWDEDMKPQKTFVAHKIPDDHVYMGMPLLHIHFLADSLEKLQEAGLELSVAHYQHLIEALIRGICVKDPMDMLIGRFEGPEARAAWDKKTQDIMDNSMHPVLAGLASLLGSSKRKSEEAPEDGKEATEDSKEADPQPWIARSMDHFTLDIPLCEETVSTMYGCLAQLRMDCHPKEVSAINRTTLVSETGAPVVLELIALNEGRLDGFLRTQRPDLLPASRRDA